MEEKRSTTKTLERITTTDILKCLFVFLLICYGYGNCNDRDSTLECHRRVYNHTITRTDRAGRTCWDTIPTVSCWGRCDSFETTDWKFPFRRSSHPVCIHDARERVRITLKNCDIGVDPGTKTFEVLQALSCKCSTCKSSEASCEGIREKESNFHPDIMILR